MTVRAVLAATLLGAALVCVLGILSWRATVAAARDVRQAVSILVAAESIEEMRMQTLKTEWKDAQNRTHTVETPAVAGESPEDHVARHKARVDALEAQYPPV